MDKGTYRDKNGDAVRVQRTATGYLIRYRDGRTITISALDIPAFGTNQFPRSPRS